MQFVQLIFSVKEIADAIIEGQTQKAEEEGEEVENAPQADAEFANKMLEAEKKINEEEVKEIVKEAVKEGEAEEKAKAKKDEPKAEDTKTKTEEVKA